MLWELRVQNLGVIDDVTVTLGPGMTALTGETGAGKTLLVEALALLLGGRADPTLVRSGATEAVVEGRFAGDGDEQVILARAVATAGRSRAWVDGRMASVSGLGEVGAQLVELHGQHLHQSLVQGAAQRGALDGFADIDLTAMHAARNRLRVLEAESAGLGGDAQQRARDADLLAYQVAEIDAAALEDEAEDDRLSAEEDRLAAASAHREAAAHALEALTGTGTGAEADERTRSGGRRRWGVGRPAPSGPPRRAKPSGDGRAVRSRHRAPSGGGDLGGRPRAAGGRAGPAPAAPRARTQVRRHPGRDHGLCRGGPGQAGRPRVG